MSDPLLRHLRSAGPLQATGRFTLDAEKALEKLRMFALPDAERYIVHVVECAVLGQATRVRVGRCPGGSLVEFDGEPFAAEELEDLLPGLLRGRWPEGHRLHPLAMAVNGVLQSLAEGVDLGSDGVRALWRPGGVEVAGGAARSGNALRLRRRARGLRALLGLAGDEWGQLRAHCPHSPARLEVFGRRVSAALDLESAVLVSRLISDEPFPPLGALPADRLERPSPGPYSAILVVGSRQLPAGLALQVAGRRHPMPDPLPPGVAALVSSRSVKLDLGRNQPVRDALYEEMVPALQEEAEWLRQVVVRDFEALSEGRRLRALPHLHQVCLERVRAGDWAGAATLAETVARDLVCTPGDGIRSAALYRTALLHHEAGREGRALDLAWEALGNRRFAGGPHTRCTVSRFTPWDGGPFPYVPMRGWVPQLLRLQTWLLEMASGVLGPGHPAASQRREIVLDLCRRHGLPEPDPTKFRDPWRSPELGGFPPLPGSD